MEKEETLNIYMEALAKYGDEAQVFMLFEECAELCNALAKHRRKRCTKEDIITELADVSIMVEQMAVLYGYDDYITEKNAKLLRLKNKLGI